MFLEGFLWKQGEKNKGWKKRWFTYSSDIKILHYYSGSDKKKELGLVDLRNGYHVEVVETPGRPFTFQIGTPASRLYLLAASSELERDQWTGVFGEENAFLFETAQGVLQLAPVEWEVEKVEVGRLHQTKRRRLRLTAVGIENIKRGKASSQRTYEQVLSASLRDLTTLVIQFENGEHPYIYSSPEAVAIVQEINLRLQKRRRGRTVGSYAHAEQLQQRLARERADTRLGGAAPALAAETLVVLGPVVAPVIAGFIKDWARLAREPATALPKLRAFLDSLEGVAATAESGRGLDEARLQAALEESVLGQLSISPFLAPDPPLPALPVLRTLSQAGHGVPERFRLASEYHAVVLQLNQLAQVRLPSLFLDQLLACVRALYNTVNTEKNDGLPPDQCTDYVVGADDFLPILTMCVVRSELPARLCSLQEAAWALAPPGRLTGEAGYYLTVLSSVHVYLLGLTPSQAEEMRAVDPSPLPAVPRPERPAADERDRRTTSDAGSLLGSEPKNEERHEGWMTKKGKKRYFVLEGGRIGWRKHPGAREHGGLALAGCRLVPAPPLTLSLQPAGYEFVAWSPAEYQAWAAALARHLSPPTSS